MRFVTYWEGEKTPVIQLCLESLKRYHPELEIHTPETIRELGGEEVLKLTEGMMKPFRSDLIRFWLLKETGGTWIDADTIAVSRLNWQGEELKADMVGTFTPRKKTGFTATPFFFRPGSPIGEQAFQLCLSYIERMQKGEKIKYGVTSLGVLSSFHEEHSRNGFQLSRLEHWRYNPIPWKSASRIYRKMDTPQYQEIKVWNPNAYTYHLTGKVVHSFRHYTRDFFLKPDQGLQPFISFLFQKAFQIFPAVPHRTASILERLPEHTPLSGAEVGVFRGYNSRNLLSSRRNLHLFLIDPWNSPSLAPDVMREDNSPSRWNEIKGAFEARMKHLGNRYTQLQKSSMEALPSFPPDSLDFVFIDAVHTEPHVKADLKGWWEKVKPGGFISGHDYNHEKFPGVVRAVQDFCNIHRLPLELGADHTFFIRKPASS